MRVVSKTIIGGVPLRRPPKDPGMDWNVTKFDLDCFEIGACNAGVEWCFSEKGAMIDSVCINHLVPANIMRTWNSEMESCSGSG